MPGMCKTTEEPFLFILLLMKSPFKEDSALEAPVTQQSHIRIAFRFEMWLISWSPGGFGYLTVVSFALNSGTVKHTAAELVKSFSSPPLSPGLGKIKATPGSLPYQCQFDCWCYIQEKPNNRTQHHTRRLSLLPTQTPEQPQCDSTRPGLQRVSLDTHRNVLQAIQLCSSLALTRPFLALLPQVLFSNPKTCSISKGLLTAQGVSLVWASLWSAPCSYGDTYRAQTGQMRLCCAGARRWPTHAAALVLCWAQHLLRCLRRVKPCSCLSYWANFCWFLFVFHLCSLLSSAS